MPPLTFERLSVSFLLNPMFHAANLQNGPVLLTSPAHKLKLRSTSHSMARNHTKLMG